MVEPATIAARSEPRSSSGPVLVDFLQRLVRDLAGRSVVELTGELRAYGRQQHPEVVVGFFTHPATCYAAQ